MAPSQNTNPSTGLSSLAVVFNSNHSAEFFDSCLQDQDAEAPRESTGDVKAEDVES